MFRILLSLSLCVGLSAQVIKFEEEKYIASLQSSVYKKGSLKIEANSIGVEYIDSNKSYVLYDDYIIVRENATEQRFSYDDKIELNIFAKLINLVYKDKKDGANDFFTLKKDGDLVVLTPKGKVSQYIEKIEYKKVQNRLVFLKISFLNDEWINIVQN